MKRSKLLIFFLTSLVIVVCVLLYYRQPHLLDGFEAGSYNFRYSLRGPLEPNRDIVIVAIDDKSVGELGRYPWTRSRYAELLDRLTAAGVKAVYFDAFFPEPESDQADAAFAAALQRSGKTSLAVAFTFAADGSVVSITHSLPLLQDAARSGPHINMTPDEDGVVRWLPLLLTDDQGLVASLSLSAAKTMLGATSIEPETCRISLGERRIPTDANYAHLINYIAPPGAYTRYSFSDVSQGRIAAALLKDKVVLVGATSLGIYDMRVTPFSNNSPGVEIHANAIDAMVRGATMERGGIEALIDLLAIVSLGILAALITLNVRHSISLPLIALMVFGHAGVVYGAFLHGHWLSIVYPEMTIILAFFSTVYLRFSLLDRRTREIRDMFSSYVSRKVVDQLVKDPSQARIGGDNRVMTVLFSDVANYTSFSEKLPPQEVVRILNQYLAEMTELIMAHEGTLDKFIGDGIMAFWNAPLEQKDHAEHAVDCALGMLEKMEELSARWQSEGNAALSLRIGINTGEVIVGNIGAAGKKMEYTVIGDNVNLASRLESINKLYGTRLMISAGTRELLPPGKYVLRRIDFVRVKGKERPLEIYEVMTAAGSELATAFETALALYRARRFPEAECSFALLAERHKDQVSRIYLERIAEFLVNPPPDDWDGSYTALRK